MKPENPTILLRARWEGGLVAMVGWSFLLHVVVALAVVAISRSTSRRERPALAYTVELTDLASLGSRGGAVPKTEAPVPRKKEAASRPAKRKPAAKKTPAKKTVVKKATPKKTVVKKTTPKKTAAKKAVPKKAVGKKAAPKKALDKKSVLKKPAAKTEKVAKSPGGADARYLAAIDRVRRRLEAGGAGSPQEGPPSAGGRGSGSGNRVVGAEFLIYYNIMISRIRQGWLWVGHESNLAVTVRFGITQQGEIRSLALDESSGNAGYDQSVMRAVNEASPLPPPPLEYQEDFRSVQLTFRPGDLRAPAGDLQHSE